MLCKKCGETLQAEEKFCPNCGAKNEITEQYSGVESESRTASSGSYQSQADSHREESVISSQEHHQSDFNSEYRATSQQSTGDFVDIFHGLSARLNNMMDPVIRTFVNMKNGAWIMWSIAVLLSAVGKQIRYSGSFFGGIILSVITVSVIFGVEVLLVQVISRNINFEYGFNKTTSSERNLLILIAIAMINMLTMIAFILQLHRLKLGWIGAILSGVLSAFILESMFYRYFKGNQAFEFIKKYLIIQIIFEIIRFILFTVVAGVILAAVVAPFIRMFNGFY